MSRRLQTLLLVLIPGFLTGAAVHGGAVQEEIVTFTTHDDLEIRCLLSLPVQGTGPFPGMLLIAGSGLHDADVTLEVPTLEITAGRQTLFKPLARHFSRQGWAVQRCNKRGASFGHHKDRPRILQDATLEDLEKDAQRALETLHGHPRVDARPLVVLGHSEGAVIATELASKNPEIDLLVLMGSVARPFADLIEYQLVDRNLDFLRRAADADGNGFLTLEELNRLDGHHGLRSVYVLNAADVLFEIGAGSDGRAEVLRFLPSTDIDSDDQLDLAREVEPALRRETTRFLELAAEGSLGRYWQSLVTAASPMDRIHRVTASILFVHGALDVQTPVDEPLALMAALESRGFDDYEILIFPMLGHSLSRPNDYFAADGGLTILDNLTLNAPKPKTRRLLWRRIEAILDR